MNDHFADFDEDKVSQERSESLENSDKKGYSEEVFSEKISAKYRTFFIDVKKNNNGNLVKISEKSRGGKKSTKKSSTKPKKKTDKKSSKKSESKKSKDKK